MSQHKDTLLYIAQYCSDFMTDKEKAASNHHIAQEKYLRFKDRSKRASEAYEKLSSDDPEVIGLLHDGYAKFQERFTQRIYDEHLDELNINRCPKCNGVARTPRAKQCRYCFHSWRDQATQ